MFNDTKSHSENQPTGYSLPIKNADITVELASDGYYVRPAIINDILCARVIVPASAAGGER